MATDERLRREIDDLGRTFGDTVRRFAGEDAFDLVESVRRLARRFCDGDTAAADELDQLLQTMTTDQLRVVISSFSGFLELANLAEDRQRVRALRDRETNTYPEAPKESVLAAVKALKEQGLSGQEVANVLSQVDIELVFTAHPTEAKRRSLRAKLRAIRGLLSRMDQTSLTPREEKRLRELLRREIAKMWQTDVLRPSRPTVLEEVRRGLSIKPVLWKTIPWIQAELRNALAEVYPGEEIPTPSMISFGSWMGGDRDGHPFVTPEITQQTLQWLREAAIERHLEECTRLTESLSLSVRQTPECSALYEPIATACAKWPELNEIIELTPPFETPRRWLRIIRWRLEQTLAEITDQPIEEQPRIDGVYTASSELDADVAKLYEVFVASDNIEVANSELQNWVDQIEAFGLHTARLDVRQHSAIYAAVMEELWRAIGLVKPDEELTEQRRQDLLIETLPIAANIAPIDLSESAQKTLQLFRVLRRSARRYGGDCLGGHVISMTSNPSDLLTVLWLWTWSERVDGGRPKDSELHLPIVPLFETIDDLKAAPQILGDALRCKAYRDHVTACGDHQIVMIGYSDSTKDGGYLAACWALQSGQIALNELTNSFGVDVTFFHGRGGSLGRGGGPAARSILSLPPETFQGSLRLTEQGEVLAERYDDPAIAHRHLEQVVWAVLIASTSDKESKNTARYRERMEQIADQSLAAYRELVDHPSFTTFFRQATPISAIEGLPIGSRPAKRKKGDRIEDLRAIPWVFSWTQSRCLLPAWYGIGGGLEPLVDQGGKVLEELQEMYREWPFFRAAINNAVLAVAKSNRQVFDRYAKRADDTDSMKEVVKLLDDEFGRATKSLLAITGDEELLDSVSWLKDSIKVRNRYVDPLNLIQLEVLRRIDAADEGLNEELQHLSQLSIKGVAAGMRTTG